MFLETPQALPRSACLPTYTYGTFLSSQRSGKCKMISRGSVSAARIMSSATPLFKALVVSLAPFLSWLRVLAWLIKSSSSLPILLSAFGQARLLSTTASSFSSESELGASTFFGGASTSSESESCFLAFFSFFSFLSSFFSFLSFLSLLFLSFLLSYRNTKTKCQYHNQLLSFCDI